MGFYQFKREQLLNSTVDEVWSFISSPHNLQKITPEDMGFRVLSTDLPSQIYEGMIISYKVSPLLRLPMTWVTEITVVQDKVYFIDEQRMGPYKMWHHQHFLEETPQGVLMKDIVSYQPPFLWIGDIANQLIIRKKLEEIFDFRVKVLEKIFNH